MKTQVDKEYALYGNLPNHGGYQELKLMSRNLAGAKRAAKSWMSNGYGAKDVTIKYYEDHDLRHQWDYKDGQWVQYE